MSSDPVTALKADETIRQEFAGSTLPEEQPVLKQSREQGLLESYLGNRTLRAGRLYFLAQGDRVQVFGQTGAPALLDLVYVVTDSLYHHVPIQEHEDEAGDSPLHLNTLYKPTLLEMGLGPFSDYIQEPQNVMMEVVPSGKGSQALLELDIAFNNASNELFEDGMESEFSRALDSTINRYGNSAIKGVRELLSRKLINVEVKSETLKQLGLIDHRATYDSRLALLLEFLESDDMRVRDSASVGLAALDDPSALPALRMAADKETSKLLKRNLELVIDQLENTRDGSSAENNLPRQMA